MNLDPLVTALSDLPGVRLAVLFGSQARGAPRPDSDVDLAFELDPDTLEDRRRIEELVTRLVPAEADIVFLTEDDPHLRFEIARGRCLYERGSGTWARMKARAMIDWYDWQPTARWMHEQAIARLMRKVEVERGS